nr:TRAP transporter small permease [Oceaniglobus trochenteri]
MSPTAAPEAGPLGRMIIWIGIVFALGIFCSAGILFFEVIMRYVFNKPTQWAHETVIFLNGAAFAFGGLYVAAQDKHIRVVLLYNSLSEGLRRYANIAISLVCAASCGMFAWASWQGVRRSVWTPQGEFRLETSGSAWNPPFPGLMKFFLFVILIALTVQFLILAFNYARKGRTDA